MPKTRTFAYNTGADIPGTSQFGQLAVGTPSAGYESSGLKWWNGPDENLGYVIAYPNPGGQPGGDGKTADLGFFRTSTLSDADFLSLSQTVTKQTFANASSAKAWLDSNGYWTSWSSSGPQLLAELDASNPSSYPGSFNTWFDLTANNNDAILSAGSGSLTYSTASASGEFDLSGGSGTVISLADNAYTSLSSSNSKSYSIWIKADAIGFMSFSRTVMCKQQGTGGGSTSDGFFVGINSSNQVVARVTSDSGSTVKSYSGIGATISTGVWYMVTLLTKISSDANSTKLFINSTEVASGSQGGSGVVDDQRNLLLGNYDSGIQNAQAFDGMIGSLYIKEGDIAASDISTLFDDTKLRFGY